MEPPQLTGEALALYTFVQAQLQEVHNAAAAVNQETQNRLAAVEKGVTALNQRIDMAITDMGNEVWINGSSRECDGNWWN